MKGKFKRLLAVVMALAVMLSLASCADGGSEQSETKGSSGTAESTAIADGTYTGVGTGKGGEIKVEITIANDTITAIDVLSNSETAGFADAMDTLGTDIIAVNSLQVDTVSGCTLTSNGFLEAVNDALASAGATADMLKPISGNESQASIQEIEQSHEIIVIGAGGAGFCAAIEAKENGADVIILEKMPMVGGNTLISGAEYAAPGNWIQQSEGIEDSPDLMAQDMLIGGDNVNDPVLVQVVAENALADAIWLRDDVGVIWEDELMFFGGHSVKRSLIPQGASGVEIITKLQAKAEELAIPVLTNTRATELISDESGRIVGVKAEGDGVNYTFTAAKGVILATGGFGSNLEMRTQYNPDIDASILSTNSVGSTGDGIIMAQQVGAELTGMEHIQTYPICDPLTGTLLYFDDARLYGYSVIVNLEGERFVEELGRRDEMSMAIKAQTGSCCYEIIDQLGFDESKLEENHAAELEYLYTNDLLVKADTLEEAAAFFGIDYETMKKTIDDYNSYVEAGSDPEFNKRSLPTKIEQGPFYILKAVPAVHHTMGGIKINEDAQVIGTDGEIIAGLYAAGETTGGIHGTNRLGSCALADITVFGRIAGRNAAK